MIQFIEKNEKYSVEITSKIQDSISAFLDYPVKLYSIIGSELRARYNKIECSESKKYGIAEIEDVYGNKYIIKDCWCENGQFVKLDREVKCVYFKEKTGIRITTEFRCQSSNGESFDDYQFLIPGAFYNKNDTDEDGEEDYLGNYVQDYRDDRNPNLFVMGYSIKDGAYLSLIRADIPQIDKTITREKIKKRHFIHNTDIGSFGISPSSYQKCEFLLRADYPFYERNSFCLNVDGSEWSAYKEISEGAEFSVSYALNFGTAENLTNAAWDTVKLQMKRILDSNINLLFTLEEAQECRREMVHNSFREFPEKRGKPAGYFVHFSPRKGYGKQNLLEYGFCGAQTLLSLDMLKASDEEKNPEYRNCAVKTIDFLVDHCIDDSGLPNGIYNVDNEEFVYWWTGILFPFQYSKDRNELERYLGKQMVAALMSVASELEKNKGNYCRSMVDTMYYLMKCFLYEKEQGHIHAAWIEAIEKFCDVFAEMQNEDGSWNRGYTMKGEALVKPVEWFGTSVREQHSGVLFPIPLFTEFYRYSGDEKYLKVAKKGADYILKNCVKDAYYIGGINDTSHKKSVKIDAAAAMFAMRSMLCVYDITKEKRMLEGAEAAAKILATWTYLWNIPFGEDTLLAKHNFKTTGWAGCDVIPAGSYVDCSFQEVVPDLLKLAQYSKNESFVVLAKIVTLGMQNGMSTVKDMYGYSIPGVQCEGYMTSLWLSDTADSEFSGAAAKNKGDDNDTCNGFVNGMALWNLDCIKERYGTFDFDEIIKKTL